MRTLPSRHRPRGSHGTGRAARRRDPRAGCRLQYEQATHDCGANGRGHSRQRQTGVPAAAIERDYALSALVFPDRARTPLRSPLPSAERESRVAHSLQNLALTVRPGWSGAEALAEIGPGRKARRRLRTTPPSARPEAQSPTPSSGVRAMHPRREPGTRSPLARRFSSPLGPASFGGASHPAPPTATWPRLMLFRSATPCTEANASRRRTACPRTKLFTMRSRAVRRRGQRPTAG